jgi:hypothetical protein
VSSIHPNDPSWIKRSVKKSKNIVSGQGQEREKNKKEGECIRRERCTLDINLTSETINPRAVLQEKMDRMETTFSNIWC